MTDNRVERQLAAILAADVAGYSRLMGADEEGVLARQESPCSIPPSLRIAGGSLKRPAMVAAGALLDNGSSYVADDLARWLEDKGIEHVRGTPYHPQTQGKIERWHQTLKNRILLDNYYLPESRTADQRLRRAL